MMHFPLSSTLQPRNTLSSVVTSLFVSVPLGQIQLLTVQRTDSTGVPSRGKSYGTPPRHPLFAS